jgi:transcription initiation factor TFIIB
MNANKSFDSLNKEYNSTELYSNTLLPKAKESQFEEQNFEIDQNSYKNQNINITNKEESNQKTSKNKQSTKKDSNPSQIKINKKIEEFSKKMCLSPEIIEKVKILTNKVSEEKKIKIKLLDSIIASIIFIACRNADEPKTMQEISSQLNLDKKVVNRCFNSIKDIIVENKNQIPHTVSGLINTYCDKLIDNENNKNLKNVSNEIANNVCTYELIAGRNPNTIAAACILIADRLLDLKIGKKIISKKVGTTENTISSAFCILKEYIDSIVPIEFKDELYLLNEI